MATGVKIDAPGQTVDSYREMNRKMFGGNDAPDTPPQGLILHTAGEVGGALRIFDVWETREDFERFVEEFVRPVMGDVEGPEPEIYELASVVTVATLTATR
jgi:hypothetical protein